MGGTAAIRRCIYVFILPVLLIGLFSGCSLGSGSNPPDYTATIAEARTASRQALADSGATAISLALVDEKGIIWTESQGHADIAAGTPVTADTAFCIGSVSKMFAAIAVMQLVEKGRLALDEPIVTYLKTFSMASPEYANITVRMLLNHSSGLPGGDTRDCFTSAPFTGYAAQVMENLTYQRLKHAPGYLNVYSNDGFTMVENLVQALTGLGFPEYVRQNILIPLEMNHSRYTDDYLPDGSYAKTYTGKTAHPYASLNFYASGALYASAADMAKLMMMMLNRGVHKGRQILSADSIAAMSQDQTVGTFNPSPSDMLRYGLGWDTMTQPGLKTMGISGWQKGGSVDGFYGTMFRAVLTIAPEAKLGVAVMMASNNISSDTVEKVGERVLLKALVARGGIQNVPAALTQNPLPLTPPSPEEKNTFSGFYAESGMLHRLGFAADGSLNVDSYGETGWTPLYANFRKRSDGWYAADSDSITALRLLSASGRDYVEIRKPAAAEYYTTTNLMAQRLAARSAVSAAWQARTAVRWLPVNVDWQAGFLDLPTDYSMTLFTVEGLAGYLFANLKVLRDMEPQTDSRMDGMFLQIPQVAGRDLVDAVIERHEASDWLRVGSTLYRPLSGVPTVGAGLTTVIIGSEGFAEWRKLPASGSIAIGNATAWRLYDSSFRQKGSGAGSGAASLPGTGDASYLYLFGKPGITINLNVSM